jgi:hypothetical protein
MCKMCEASGLLVDCKVCGGFDWVEDVYVWARDPDAFDKSLCESCLRKWLHKVGFESRTPVGS